MHFTTDYRNCKDCGAWDKPAAHLVYGPCQRRAPTRTEEKDDRGIFPLTHGDQGCWESIEKPEATDDSD